MSLHLKPAQIIAGVATGAMLAGGGYAFAASRGKTIHVCIGDRSHVMLAERHCAKGYSALVWNQQGPAGPRGRRGARGAIGRRGAPGQSGPGASVSVGTVTTGSSAAVTNTGSTANAVLNFTLPQTVAGIVTAYGQVWPGASGTAGSQPVLKNANSNVVAVQGAGAGGYAVIVKGCAASDQAEPVINVSANVDSHDPNNTGETPVLAFVEGWQTDQGGQFNRDLEFDVFTVNTQNGDALIDSDFAFTVIC